MINLFVFISLYISNFKNKSAASFLYGLQVLSLSGVYFVGEYYVVDSFTTAFNTCFTILILVLIISPWRKYKNIKEIVYLRETKIRKVTIFLLGVNLIIFISLVIISIFVFTFFDEINELKYSGDFMDILYDQFPIFVKGYLLAYYLHSLSYFLIVLHFYYLKKGSYKMSIYCFILSLNIVLYGLTFFSRWTIVNYVLLYFLAFFMFKNSLDKKIRKKIFRISTIFVSILIFLFVSISYNRFDENISYSNKIPRSSIIQNPTAFSLFDYLSQSHVNGMRILDDYNFETFNGQASFSALLSLLEQYGIINEYNYLEIREEMLPDNYWLFNGLVSELVYDFGYIITFILAIFYYLIVKKLRPIGNAMSLKNAFIIILLLQVPLLAIFYSSVASLVMPLILLIPIYLYLYLSKI
ncbi:MULTISPECIES: O-antigen polymerase [unclassified Polaribacter]|uniref:O-antigen polymerase n=1 Tax=unclassified Polaribacter TaxID=196858 RepID=UPI0011BF72D6|nr:MULTISPECIES: O-antigen polymerase [unclassified Polaribacter]TXD50337.1 oligosaccharide repeat unit polymerase [Polaribacter sp. IC063]TXD57182.1 oligosaccharide repeat unit polymerase [Polaribacter sp. IC066]